MTRETDSAMQIRTRPLVVGICMFTLTVWASVGLLTGHMYLQYFRGPPAHFEGIAALFLSMALVALAAVLGAQLRSRRVQVGTKNRTATALFYAAGALLVCAVAAKTFGSVDWLHRSFSGVLSEEMLRLLLRVPGSRQFVDVLQPYASAWLLWSCILLVLVAVLCKLAGATKDSLERHPLLSVFLSLVFGLPLMMWLSLELVGYTFSYLPAGDGLGFTSARSAMALSMVVAVSSLWIFAALALVVLVFRLAGRTVRWRSDAEPALSYASNAAAEHA